MMTGARVDEILRAREPDALDQLMRVVYDELRRLPHQHGNDLIGMLIDLRRHTQEIDRSLIERLKPFSASSALSLRIQPDRRMIGSLRPKG